ncbi:hypothetical protein BSU04_32020 [Caballeronia sordidicola]|uniref:Uncharacterized protein n=1 Tax=Caballeronia sordidicola TaxID=196367 RepID=A0A226WTA8_CABSO|nr:hypothetical protein BSU04_32020 [Caballeronia sordidicola]
MRYKDSNVGLTPQKFIGYGRTRVLMQIYTYIRVKLQKVSKILGQVLNDR